MIIRELVAKDVHMLIPRSTRRSFVFGEVIGMTGDVFGRMCVFGQVHRSDEKVPNICVGSVDCRGSIEF